MSPSNARAHVSAVLREWQVSEDTAYTAALVMTELFTNAVQATQKHGLYDPVRLWMLGDQASVLFLIWDATSPAPVFPAAPSGEHGRGPDLSELPENGRGLDIVAALSKRWGCYYPDEPPYGKVVWAILAPSASSPEAAEWPEPAKRLSA